MELKDEYRHKGMRKKLIEELRRKGIKHEPTLAAMAKLPRHFFLDNAFEEWAYVDKAFPIGHDQTISQPYTVAIQTILLDVNQRDRVLEVGTGSGYQAAILGLLGGRVFTIERQEPLFYKTKALLEELRAGNIRCFLKDGYLGLPEFAPFDRIIVTAGAPEIPPELVAQLKVGGIMVIPVGSEGQTMIRITKIDEKKVKTEEFGAFKFVPMLKGINHNKDGLPSKN